MCNADSYLFSITCARTGDVDGSGRDVGGSRVPCLTCLPGRMARNEHEASRPRKSYGYIIQTMKYIANKVNFLCVLIFLVVVDFPAVECEVVLQSISATVGAQNFTYYRLSRRGRIRLELLSPEGDADIYVSDKTLKPSFENYELESVTCGMDQVEIPAAFRRPVGVAIYGYPIHFSSSYHLTIILVSEWDEYDEYEALNSESSEKITKRTAPPKKEIFTEVETDSLIWTVFIGILKIIFDILL